MKKILSFLILMLLFNSLDTYAQNDVSLSINCEKLELNVGGQTSCSLEASINSLVKVDNMNLDFNKDLDLDVSFEPFRGWSGNIQNNRLVLGANEEVSGKVKLGTLKIKVLESASYGAKEISFRNISFSNTKNPVGLYNASNVAKTINVLSDDNTLEYIKINNKVIDSFSKDKLKYENINLDLSMIEITALANDEKAKVEGTGEKELVYGKNTFEIKVTSELGNTKVYTLIINRIDNRSKDNTLRNLKIEGITFAFDKKKTTYKLNVLNDVDKIVIDSTLNDDKASYVKDFGDREVDLEYGDNTIEIKVEAENGDVNVYTLIINREDIRSDEAILSTLVINGEKVNIKDDVFEYNLSLRYKHKKTEVVATTNSKAKIEYKDIDLKVGNNQLIIKVVSEKKTTNQYKINIKRLNQEESRVSLTNIEVKGYQLNYSKDITDYNLKINKDVKSLEFVFHPNEEEITHTIEGNENLENGSIIRIKARDDFGEYIIGITISKDVDPKLILGIFTIEQLCYIVFTIGLFAFLSSIIYMLNNKKSY